MLSSCWNSFVCLVETPTFAERSGWSMCVRVQCSCSSETPTYYWIIKLCFILLLNSDIFTVHRILNANCCDCHPKHIKLTLRSKSQKLQTLPVASFQLPEYWNHRHPSFCLIVCVFFLFFVSFDKIFAIQV